MDTEYINQEICAAIDSVAPFDTWCGFSAAQNQEWTNVQTWSLLLGQSRPPPRSGVAHLTLDQKGVDDFKATWRNTYGPNARNAMTNPSLMRIWAFEKGDFDSALSFEKGSVAQRSDLREEACKLLKIEHSLMVNIEPVSLVLLDPKAVWRQCPR